jgi:hypothetical protein
VSWSHQLSQAESDQFTLDHLLGPGSYWNSWINNATSGWGTSNYPSVTSYTSWGTGDTWAPPAPPVGPTWIPEPGGMQVLLLSMGWLVLRGERRAMRGHR